MASLKLAAALAVIVLVSASATTTATASRPYQPAEDCKTQAGYFLNCLRLGFHETCCGEPGRKSYVVKDKRCFCAVEQQADIECAKERKCSNIAGKVKIASLKLSCLRDLDCKKRA